MEGQVDPRDIPDTPDPPRRRFGVSEAPLQFYWFKEDQIADGLPAEQLRTVALQICGDQIEANKLIHAIVPKSSLSRRGKLTLTQGEQTERLMRLFTQAQNAFQDLEDAREFMRRPHPELGCRRPIDAAMTELGGRNVERVLDSLLYGLPV
jgi:putative toxin-antitoxin system antitoxin component (TIGR02293 family)